MSESTWTRPICEYFNIRVDGDGEPYMEVYLSGIAVLRLVLTNKGTAFTREERVALRLDGLLPPEVNTLQQQVDRAYDGYTRLSSPIRKYQYLRSLQERHEILFFALLSAHLEEMLPIVYTPTVGQAVQLFNTLYQNPRGLSFSTHNIDRADTVVGNYPMTDVRIIVATDSSAILGIGDQGYGGLAIAIGKLALYTSGGGVSPFHTLPVLLDVGTERDDLLSDPMYLGSRQRRLIGDDHSAFVDRFVDAVRRRWPRAIIQWEDLSKETAFAVWERYRDALPSFNDDIQGTGAVALAGVLSACRLADEHFPLQRFLIYGAGAGGIGVASAIRGGLIDAGVSPEDARRQVLVLDSKGLLVADRPMAAYKSAFAQDPADVAGWQFAGQAPDLLETIREAGVTVLLGLSGQRGAFDEAIVRAVADNTPNPIIFPLSNPTTYSEAAPADILEWTDGRALVATGSPFDDVEIDGKRYPVGQGNNAFIFPGLGMGAALAEARAITDGMVQAAAYALTDYTEEHHLRDGRIYPPVSELQAVSREVAARVIEHAVLDGVAEMPAAARSEGIHDFVEARFWEPRYLRFVPGERQ